MTGWSQTYCSSYDEAPFSQSFTSFNHCLLQRNNTEFSVGESGVEGGPGNALYFKKFGTPFWMRLFEFSVHEIRRVESVPGTERLGTTS